MAKPKTKPPAPGLLYGDFMELVKGLADNSIDSVVTDPPYNLGFMGKVWDKTGVAFQVGTWREVLRVMKPGAHLLAFGGPRTYHRMACAIEAAGFEIRDQIMWVYGSGFPKNKKLGMGMGTALKPAHEPICLARKPLSEKTIAENVRKHGTGGINIEGCRVGVDLVGWTGRGPGKTKYNGGWKNGQPSPVRGRWPANFIHDGSPEVEVEFPPSNRAGGVRIIYANASGTGRAKGHGVPHTSIDHGDSGSASRFFYCAKASKSERNLGLESFGARQKDPGRNENFDTIQSRLHGSIKKQNHHPTVKPVALMAYLVRLVTPPGGVVLDPFMGSGTTGIACVRGGFGFIGMENQKDYFRIATARIRHATALEIFAYERKSKIQLSEHLMQHCKK